MDLFKFTDNFRNGVLINGATSKMWVERYADAGEFEIKAPLSSGLLTILPEGTKISHTQTKEVMIVEDHQITDTGVSHAQVIITGRSYETITDNRQVGTNLVWPQTAGDSPVEYSITADTTWEQVKYLLEQNLLAANLIDSDNAIGLIQILTEVDSTGIAGPNSARVIKKGSLYSGVVELLKLNELGVKTIRPGLTSPLVTNKEVDLALVVHNGVDRTTQVVFAYDAGEIEDADYLWSIRNLKTSAYVTGKWVEAIVHGSETGSERRVMHVDASDLDENLSAAPTGTDHSNIVDKMVIRGQEALASQKKVEIAKVEIVKTTTRYSFREHFNIGDKVTVDGNFNASKVMRVIEYVEIEDETGSRNYPTLSTV
jgi:hypothetical protein